MSDTAVEATAKGTQNVLFLFVLMMYELVIITRRLVSFFHDNNYKCTSTTYAVTGRTSKRAIDIIPTFIARHEADQITEYNLSA